jgi:hypothetical protein
MTESPQTLQTSANRGASSRLQRLDTRTREGRAGRPEAKCEVCGDTIENPRPGQRFCYWPRKCRKSKWAEEHRRPYLDERPPRPCEHCGEPIQNPRSNQRYCRQPRNCRSLAGYDRACARGPSKSRIQAPGRIGDESDALPVATLPAISPARASETALIGILIESMPAPGSSWPRDARAQWLKVLERTLDALYPGGG